MAESICVYSRKWCDISDRCDDAYPDQDDNWRIVNVRAAAALPCTPPVQYAGKTQSCCFRFEWMHPAVQLQVTGRCSG